MGVHAGGNPLPALPACLLPGTPRRNSGTVRFGTMWPWVSSCWFPCLGCHLFIVTLKHALLPCRSEHPCSRQAPLIASLALPATLQHGAVAFHRREGPRLPSSPPCPSVATSIFASAPALATLDGIQVNGSHFIHGIQFNPFSLSLSLTLTLTLIRVDREKLVEEQLAALRQQQVRGKGIDR